MLVERDDGRALLARNARWRGDMYSCLAGFVEPGETVEDAVRREVREEVGITIDGLRYHGSQPWPFPHSLMLGFHARYAGGEICCDGSEIADARWFAPDDLPELPGPISIARWLIDDWVARSLTPARLPLPATPLSAGGATETAEGGSGGRGRSGRAGRQPGSRRQPSGWGIRSQAGPRPARTRSQPVAAGRGADRSRCSRQSRSAAASSGHMFDERSLF